MEKTPKNEKELEKFIRSGFIRTKRSILRTLYSRCYNNSLKLEDIKEEVIKKTSPLSKAQRDFLTVYKIDFIRECINDMIESDGKLEKYSV